MLDIEEVVPMLRRPRIVPTTIVTLLAVFGSRAAAQTVQRSIVVLPPVEIGANVSFTERFDTPPGQHDWTGPGLSLVANANLTRHVALAVEANTFDGQTTLLAGARLGTDFYYGSSRDPVPGRFVGRVLIGSVASGTATSNFGVQIGSAPTCSSSNRAARVCTGKSATASCRPLGCARQQGTPKSESSLARGFGNACPRLSS
jgi:hypothetical protein